MLDMANRIEKNSNIDTHNVTVAVEEVTPKMANEILAQNDNFRQPEASRVREYAALMNADLWTLNGESIKINSEGSLIDGQHRLLACIKAQKPFYCVVVRGISEGAMDIDRGRPRNFAELLEYYGEKNCKARASAILAAYKYEHGGLRSSHMASIPAKVLLAWYRHNPDISTSFDKLFGKSRGKLRPREAIVAHWVMSHIDADDADAFWDIVLDHSQWSIREDCPAVTLSKKLYQPIASRRKGRPMSFSTAASLAMIFRAWNYYRRGRSLKRLQLPDMTQKNYMPEPI